MIRSWSARAGAHASLDRQASLVGSLLRRGHPASVAYQRPPTERMHFSGFCVGVRVRLLSGQELELTAVRTGMITGGPRSRPLAEVVGSEGAS